MNTFQQASLDLGLTQTEIVETLVQEMRRQGLIHSTMEQDQERQRLLDAITAGEPSLRFRPQEGRTNSGTFNQSLDEISLDLQSLFAHLLKLDGALNKHQHLHQSVVQAVKIAVRRLRDDLDHTENRLRRGLGAGALFEAFRDPASFESDLTWYTDETGQALPEANKAQLDLDQEGVKLPLVYSENALVSSTGLRLARIAITKQLGGGLMRTTNPHSGLEKAVDSSQETFWSEAVIADQPIRVELGPTHENLRHGAVCELEIRFDSATVINEISCLPFAEYPMDIVSIKAYTTDSDGEEPDVLVSLALGNNTRSLDAVVYQFPDTPVKRLVILLNQIHYTRTDLLVSTREQRKVEQILSALPSDPDEIEVNADHLSPPVLRDRYEQEPALALLHKALTGQQSPDVERLFEMQQENVILPVTKYVYDYGLFDLGVKRREYADLGVYTSRPYPVNQAVRGVRLSADATLPPGTSIAYFVSAGGNWHPIDPEGPLVDFVAASRQNGLIVPHWDQYRHAGTDARGRITLPTAPFIDWEKLYQSTPLEVVTVTITDANGVRTTAEDRTSYLGPDLPLTDGEPLQFKQTGPRQIQLNRALDQSYTVAIQYPYIVRELRLKAVLRRDSDEAGTTPILHDYTLQIVR